MSEPPSPIIEDLNGWCRQLSAAAKDDPDSMVTSEDQLLVENLIAAGVASLAGEDEPKPALVASPRRVLARDLLVTADLVRRSLMNSIEE